MPQDGGDRSARPRIVIVGAGFGGLSAALGLRRVAADITVVDRQNHHLFQPLLYQVATAALSPAEVAVPIRAILRRQPHTEVLLDELAGIDVAGRRVLLRSGAALPYDHLILATGCVYSYFGHDGWAAEAPSLKTVDDALAIRRHLLMAFEAAEACRDEAERRRLLTFVLIGAGPTGVEMAGAMAELARRALVRDFRRIDPRTARIILVEAGPRVLSSFPETLSRYAARALERMGVEVLVGAAVDEIDEEGVIAGGRRIVAGTVLWCAGVKATPVGTWLGMPTARNGAVEVAPDLSVPGHPEIFVVGDAALVRGADGRPLPGVAPVAKQHGAYVADLLARRVRGEPAPPPFAYRDPGNLATIGHSAAVADFGRIRLTGWLGWLVWTVAHIYYLIDLRNRVVVFTSWMWALLTYARAARLITGQGPPPGAVTSGSDDDRLHGPGATGAMPRRPPL